MTHKTIRKDCLVVLNELPEEIFDAVIVEPNYNQWLQYDPATKAPIGPGPDWTVFASLVKKVLKENTGTFICTDIPSSHTPGNRCEKNHFMMVLGQMFKFAEITRWIDSRNPKAPVEVVFYAAAAEGKPPEPKKLPKVMVDPVIGEKESIPGIVWSRVISSLVAPGASVCDPMAGYGGIARACRDAGIVDVTSIEIEPVFYKYLQQV